MCLYPKIIKNKKYTKTKKNGGIIPPLIDKRMAYVPTKCGKCMECKKQKAREWQVRLLEDIRHHKNGIFVTLTFSNESIINLTKDEGANRYKRGVKKGQKKTIKKWEETYKLQGYELDNAIATKAVRRFTERWRKKYKKAPRHWLVTELGHQGTENVHMHGIIWTDEDRAEIEKIWQYGYVWVQKKEKGYANEAIINYSIKYVHKQDMKHREYKPIVLNSQGIGRGYMKRDDAKRNKYGKQTKETYTTRNGHKIALPIYLRNKIYTEEEREKLWIEKLDKEERWINGVKIDISKGEEEYYKVLAEARKKNDLLGYGNDKINWERKKYENERRNINYMRRKGMEGKNEGGKCKETD